MNKLSRDNHARGASNSKCSTQMMTIAVKRVSWLTQSLLQKMYLTGNGARGKEMDMETD
jgi:hypothetical protein